MEKTKITFKIYERLYDQFEKGIKLAFLKRDAFLNNIIKAETDYLAQELDGRVLSTEARLRISRELQRLGTRTINVVVDKSTATSLNRIVKKHNIVRDAFLNRLILFLISRDTVLRHFQLPTDSAEIEFDYPGSPTATGPILAIQAICANPFYYLRIAANERWATGLYLLRLPEKFLGVEVYLENKDLPGSDEYLIEELLFPL
jgi:hypothetical protein